MDINSIIEMINKKKRKLSYVPIEQKIHNEIYNDACDDIIEQLRKMSDKPTDAEIAHIASEMASQDWSRLKYQDIYYKAFIDGAKYFK